MAAERLSMRKIKELLRLRAAGHANRSIAQSLGISHSTARLYRQRVEAAGLSWSLPSELSDGALEGAALSQGAPFLVDCPVPDWAEIHRELKRKGVTLQLLWLEYKEREPEGLQYSRFCGRYREWRDRVDVVLRQEHRAGEKVFVDFAGQTVPIISRENGEVREAQIVVGVLGASNFTYAEACESKDLSEWIGAHVRIYE